jgi:electron transfer flavoprotein beta subunit
MLKIVVPIKQVAALDDDVELDVGATEVDPDQLEWSLNEWDEFSLEAALQIKESEDDAEIVVVTVGDDEAEEGLLACLAKGADRGIRIWDEALRDLDPMATSALLAEAVRRETPDLVLCGVQASDAVNSATGVALAARLGLNRVAVVRRIELRRPEREAIVDRELEGGLIEQLSVRLPTLLTVQTGINEPRYATLRAIKQAAGKPLEDVSATDLGIDLDSVRGARTVALSLPPRGERARILDGDIDTIAAEIVGLIKKHMDTTDGAIA